MKKIVFSLLVLIIFINACQKTSESDYSKKSSALSDLQVTTCNTAHDAGTCDTRLTELGIVLKEDCCKSLGKCC